MKRFLISLALVFVAVCVYAQPRKTIVTVAVAPENADWQYDCGDKVTFASLPSGLHLQNHTGQKSAGESLLPSVDGAAPYSSSYPAPIHHPSSGKHPNALRAEG